MSDVNQEDFDRRMKKTIESMSGHDLLRFDEVFDTTMPKQALCNDLQKSKLERATAKARLRNGGEPNIFLDLASGRGREPEAAEDVSTCVRPTHHVYSSALGRCLCAKEFWNCQGLFESSFENPAAVRDVMQNHSHAQDLAGQNGVQKDKRLYIYIICSIYIIIIYIYVIFSLS